MFSESSSSAFIQSGPISNKWSEITLLQVRSRNALYTGIRHGRKFLIKAIKPVYGDAVASPYATQSKVLHEKEFRLDHDIKLDNIMITTNGSNVKLIDFGLSNTDDPTYAIFVGSVWDQYFTSKYNTLLKEVSTNRTKWPYPY